MTDFQVYIDLAKMADMQADYGDVGFADIDGNALDFFLESSDVDRANIFVEVATIADGGSTIYVYYDTAGASITASNGKNTFPIFDDFTAGSLDTALWETFDGKSLPTFSAANDRCEFAPDNQMRTKTNAAGMDIFMASVSYENTASKIYQYISQPPGGDDEGVQINSNSANLRVRSYTPGGGATTGFEVERPASNLAEFHLYEVQFNRSAEQGFAYVDYNYYPNRCLAANDVPTPTFEDISHQSIGAWSSILVYQHTTNGTSYLDWIAGRKFADPMPQALAGVEEAQ